MQTINKNPSQKLMAALVVAFFCLSGCQLIKPVETSNHVCESTTGHAKSYCYSRTNLNDAIKAANLSRADGSLSESSHDQFLKQARFVDALLDIAFSDMRSGGNPEQPLLAAKNLLLEIQ